MTSEVLQSSVAKILNTCYYRNNRKDIGLICSIKSNLEIMCSNNVLNRKKKVNKIYIFQHNLGLPRVLRLKIVSRNFAPLTVGKTI